MNRTYSHLQPTVGKQRPKAWVMGKTLAQIEGNDLQELVKAAKKQGYTVET